MLGAGASDLDVPESTATLTLCDETDGSGSARAEGGASRGAPLARQPTAVSLWAHASSAERDGRPIGSVMSVRTSARSPPNSVCSGAPRWFAHASHTACSTAAAVAELSGSASASCADKVAASEGSEPASMPATDVTPVQALSVVSRVTGCSTGTSP